MFLPTSRDGQDLMLRHKRAIFDIGFTGNSSTTLVRHGSDVPGGVFLASQGLDDAAADDIGCNFGTMNNVGSPGGSILLSSAPFAILAYSAITGSTGSGSVVDGDMGITPNNLSSVTNFPPSVNAGIIHAADPVAVQAMTDATAAFTAMKVLGLAGTVIPAEMGGTSLAPGNYKSTTSLGLSLTSGHSTLTLTGSGKYIFYSPSTLLTGATGSTDLPAIAFSGDATAQNTEIYWICESSATINQAVGSAGAVFRGTVIAKVSITATQTGTIDGRLFALTGAVTLSADNQVNGAAFGNTGSQLGVLIDCPKTFGGVCEKIFSVSVTELTAVAGSVGRTLKGTASSGITAAGNIAFTIDSSALDLTTESPIFRCEVECRINEPQHY